MEENETETPKGQHKGLIIGGVVVIVALVIIAAFLPPFSLGSRLGLGGGDEETTAVPSTDTAVTTSDEMDKPDAAETAVSDGEAMSVAESAPEAPADKVLVGDIYAVNYANATPADKVALDIPEGITQPEALDLYGWDSSGWQFVPSQYDAVGKQLIMTGGAQPENVAIMQIPVTGESQVGAELLPTQELPAEVLPYLNEVIVGTLTLIGPGELDGMIADAPNGPYEQYLRATNTGFIVDAQSIAALLADPDGPISPNRQPGQPGGEGGFAGVNIDYQGVVSADREAFTGLITNLAAALHEQDLKLILTLAAPSGTGSDWETGGQDWVSLEK